MSYAFDRAFCLSFVSVPLTPALSPRRGRTIAASLLRGRSLVLAKLFVVTTHKGGVTGRDRITVDRRKGVGGVAASQLIRDAGADFEQRCHYLQTHDGPIWFLLIAFEVLPHESGALAGSSDLVPQVGEFQHLFDIAQAIGPRAKVRAGEGTAVRERVIIQKAIEISEKVTPGPAYVGAAAALSSLPWCVARLVCCLRTRLLAIWLAAWLRVPLAFTLLLASTAGNGLLAGRLLLRALSSSVSLFLRFVLVFSGRAVSGFISCCRTSLDLPRLAL